VWSPFVPNRKGLKKTVTYAFCFGRSGFYALHARGLSKSSTPLFELCINFVCCIDFKWNFDSGKLDQRKKISIVEPEPVPKY